VKNLGAGLTLIRHSGLDPESRLPYATPLDSRLRGNDSKITADGKELTGAGLLYQYSSFNPVRRGVNRSPKTR